jgi:hypothetical protein
MPECRISEGLNVALFDTMHDLSRWDDPGGA